MVTILNGNMKTSPNGFDLYVNDVARALEQTTQVNTFHLADMKIHQCIGCWSCWWKTPGLCAIKDDAEPIMKAVIHSDMVVFASPVIAGFTSSLLKKIQDRLIVLIHPYIEPIKGECHHRKRYDKYPDMALLMQKEADTDDEDEKIIADIYKRLAINFHSNLKHTWFTDTQTTEEIAHDLSHI